MTDHERFATGGPIDPGRQYADVDAGCEYTIPVGGQLRAARLLGMSLRRFCGWEPTDYADRPDKTP